jgi:hypothetical protein
MRSANYQDISIKYTAVLPQVCVDELKTLAEKKVIPSVNQGIRLAIDGFLAQTKKELYEQSLREAALDAAFIKRTIETQDVFSAVDAEAEW